MIDSEFGSGDPQIDFSPKSKLTTGILNWDHLQVLQAGPVAKLAGYFFAAQLMSVANIRVKVTAKGYVKKP